MGALIRLLLRAPARFRKSFRCSWDGLKSAFRNEESFRLETLAFAALLAVLAVCPWALWKKLALSAAYLLIPLTELLNTAVEDICNLVSPAPHPLVKNAKDKGAMAVLLAIIFNAFVLATLLAV